LDGKDIHASCSKNRLGLYMVEISKNIFKSRKTTTIILISSSTRMYYTTLEKVSGPAKKNLALDPLKCRPIVSVTGQLYL